MNSLRVQASRLGKGWLRSSYEGKIARKRGESLGVSRRTAGTTRTGRESNSQKLTPFSLTTFLGEEGEEKEDFQKEKSAMGWSD